MFDKKAGIQGESLGIAKGANSNPKGYKTDGVNGSGGHLKSEYETFAPATDQAKKWNGWKTAGLKPAHEPITVFQKPLEGTYIQNIEKYNCGGMNIDACRIPFDMSDTNPATNPLYRKQNEYKINHGVDKNPSSYALKHEVGEMNINDLGRFPANVIFDAHMGEELDNQSGIRTSGTNCVRTKEGTFFEHGGLGKAGDVQITYGDTGGASRYFLKIESEDFVPFLYCAKPTKKEKGEGNTHVTVKPKALIKWLIKLVTPIDGKTIDITAGSGTHGLACEELNRDEGYKLKWVNVEMLNTEKEPYCEIAMNRIKNVI
jgi:site-specific DNA-methyltransferase (adenine-specific)